MPCVATAPHRTCACRWSLSMSRIWSPAAIKAFAGPRGQSRRTRGRRSRAPGGGAFSRSEIDAYNCPSQVWRQGPRLHQGQRKAPGGATAAVAHPQVPQRSWRLLGQLERTGAQDNDLILLRRRHRESGQRRAWGALRLKLGHDLKLVHPGWKPLWVVDFPMFEHDADESAGWPCTIR